MLSFIFSHGDSRAHFPVADPRGRGRWGQNLPLTSSFEVQKIDHLGPYLISFYFCPLYSFNISLLVSGGSRISPRRGRELPRGAPTYEFAKFSRKLHEIERIWTPGGRPKFYCVDPPLQLNLINNLGSPLQYKLPVLYLYQK